MSTVYLYAFIRVHQRNKGASPLQQRVRTTEIKLAAVYRVSLRWLLHILLCDKNNFGKYWLRLFDLAERSSAGLRTVDGVTPRAASSGL